MALLGVVAFIELLSAGSGVLQVNLLTRAKEGQPVSRLDVQSNDARQRVVDVCSLIAYLASGVAFLVWFYRAHANLSGLGAEYLTYSPGWAVGWFFVPIFSLFRPL